MNPLKIDPIKTAHVLLIAIVLYLGMCLTSCSAEKRIARIIKKHPELVKNDTVYGVVYDTVPAIAVKTEIETNKDVSGVDSILMFLNGKIDQISKAKLSGEIKNYIINRSIIKDTITKVIDGVTVKVYQHGDKIEIVVNKPKEVREVKAPISVNSLVVEKAYPLKDRIVLWIAYNSWWIAILLYICYRIFGPKITSAIRIFLKSKTSN